MSKHTPNNITLCGADRGGCACRQMWDEKGSSMFAVALCCNDQDYTAGEGFTEEVANANAAEMVNRWNSHDALVAENARLREALALFACKTFPGGHPCFCFNPPVRFEGIHSTRCEITRAALAATE